MQKRVSVVRPNAHTHSSWGGQRLSTLGGVSCASVWKKWEPPTGREQLHLSEFSFNLFTSLKWLAGRGANGLFRDLLLFSFFLPLGFSFDFPFLYSFLIHSQYRYAILLVTAFLSKKSFLLTVWSGGGGGGGEDGDGVESRALAISGIPTRSWRRLFLARVDYANKVIFEGKKVVRQKRERIFQWV